MTKNLPCAPAVRSVEWNSDGTMLAAVCSDNVARIWDAKNLAILGSLEEPTNGIGYIAWSPDSRKIAGTTGKSVTVWDIKSLKPVVTSQGHTDFVTSVSWSPDNKYFASGSLDGTIRIWDTMTGRNTITIQDPAGVGTVLLVKWSPRGNIVASGGTDGVIRLWDTDTGSLRRTLGTPSVLRVSTLAWNPDANSILDANSELRLWDVITGQRIAVFQGHTLSVDSVAWSPDGKTFASSAKDGTIRIWEVNTAKTLHIYKAQN